MPTGRRGRPVAISRNERDDQLVVVVVVAAIAMLRCIAVVFAFVVVVVVARSRALPDANAIDVDVIENRQPEPQLDVVRGSHVREAAESWSLLEHDLEARDSTGHRPE